MVLNPDQANNRKRLNFQESLLRLLIHLFNFKMQLLNSHIPPETPWASAR